MVQTLCLGTGITGVAQRYERQTFNLVVRGSIPLIGITEGDTAHGAFFLFQLKTTCYKTNVLLAGISEKCVKQR